jgi:hypothetical protein
MKLGSTHIRPARSYEWMVLLLACGGGFAWGLLSLALWSSWCFAAASGAARVILAFLCLPLHLAFWLGRLFELPFVDPTGLVLATGALIALAAAAACLGVLRWRDR